MNKIIKKKDILILVALKKELPKNCLNDFNVIYTGVGKVNASFAIYNSYLKFRSTLKQKIKVYTTICTSPRPSLSLFQTQYRFH